MGWFDGMSKAEKAEHKAETEKLLKCQRSDLREAQANLARLRADAKWDGANDPEAYRYLIRQAENAVNTCQHNIREMTKWLK